MAFSTTDTIVAIATPPGRGAIGVVRLSGPDARRVAHGLLGRTEPLDPRHATFATARLMRTDSENTPARQVDHLIATYFPGPRSYTGEDVVELSAHGNPVVLRMIVEAAMAAGARLAEPGEFTLRAFLNGRMDLPQAEAVADLIDAATPLQARAAFDQLQGTLTKVIGAINARLFDLIARLEASVDFPEEGFHFIDRAELVAALDDLHVRLSTLLAEERRGRLLREGLTVAIVGKPNVGKSSVFNTLVGSARAIVTEVPGTTRDLVTEAVELDGLRLTLVDTAGLRTASDIVEAEGVARARLAHTVADLTLVILDRGRPPDEDDRETLSQTSENKRLIVHNKSDLPAAWQAGDMPEPDVVMSATTGTGVEELRRRIAEGLDVDLLGDSPSLTNLRHIKLVQQAHGALVRACDAVRADDALLSEEFVLADLQLARAALEEISGRKTSDDVLAHIFSRFCVGK